MNYESPSRTGEGHLRGQEKLSRIPIKVNTSLPRLRKPEWIKIKPHSSSAVENIKRVLREHNLYSVCEEAACPNLSECFSAGTATFMILGDKCTRRCPFCDVAHGRPSPPDQREPQNLAKVIKDLNLNYTVITSVDRDDLLDGGAEHFVSCIKEIRKRIAKCKVEILTPDFRGRRRKAIDILSSNPPDVLNHNLETVPDFYKRIRPGSSYIESLLLLSEFKEKCPEIPTKSGLMLGLGESKEQVVQVLKDLRKHNCTMLTLGQYLQPSIHHLAVERYLAPKEFDEYKEISLDLGFAAVASGPLVRSSYFADQQLSSALSL